MILSLSLRFYLNKNKEKGGRCPIYFRITVNRKKAEVATIYMAEFKDWDDAKQRTKKNSQINEELTSLETEVYTIVKRIEKEKKALTAHTIKNYLTHKDKLDAYLLDFYDNYVVRLRKAGEVDEITITRYNETRAYLLRFLEERKQKEILMENINYQFINDFDLFLLSLKDRNNKKLMERNTVNKHHSRLRTMVIRALKEGYMHKSPYADFKLKNTASKRTFLSQEELEQIIEHELGGNESLKRVRDIFVFSVYTGLRFEDAQQLTMDRIIKDKKGNYTLQISQEKTDEPLSVPLLKPAMDIVEKYKDSPERKVFKKVLPKITNQKLNAYLKTIADLAGISKTLSHHVARHTCATTILLSNEVPIEVVSKWLGHTNIKTTQIYAKITNTYMQNMADKIDKKIIVKK
jgi:integrase/recombinase XerD